MNKVKISSEVAYLIGIILMALSVAMITAANFGVSMLIAPSLILSMKFNFLTFGQWEYIIQGTLFIIMCIWVKKIKPIYFFSFLSSVAFATFLDLFRLLPFAKPEFYLAFENSLTIRILLFVVADLLIGISLAFAFKSYLYPQTTDFFTKCITFKFNYNISKFKMAFDSVFLIISILLSLIAFHDFTGIGIGTVVITLFNGPLIGLFTRVLNKFFVFKPTFKKFSRIFEM